MKSDLFYPLSRTVNSIYQPILGWGNSIVNASTLPFSYAKKWLKDRKSLLNTFDEHKRLSIEHLQLQLEYGELKRKISDLRDQLRVDIPTATPFITESVIGMPTDHYFRNIILAIYQSEKIKRGQVVRTPEGLVGRVSNVNWRTASVRLLNDPQSRVPVKTQTGQSAILMGRGSSSIKLDFVNESTEDGAKITLEDGDILYTSGVDEVFPTGIPVAKVVVSGGEYLAKLLVDQKKLKFVQVLLGEE